MALAAVIFLGAVTKIELGSAVQGILPLANGGTGYAASTVARTSAATMTNPWTSTGLVLPALPANTTRAGQCRILWQLSSVLGTTAFGVGMSATPTGLWGSARTTYAAGGSQNFLAFTQTATATTAVSTAVSPGSAATTYETQIDFTLATASNAVQMTVYGQSSSALYTLTVQPGSSCSWLP